MFSWLTSFLVFFLHNNPAQVNATVQQHSAGTVTTMTDENGHPTPTNGGGRGDGGSNGTDL